jgi:ATP-dependent 26S proteasome regulatory subunit
VERTQITVHDIIGTPIDASKSKLLRNFFAMTGLGAVKDAVRSMVQLASDNFARELAGLKPQSVSLHRLFLGNPGTGKTTEIYGQVLREMGYLSNGEVIVVGASQLMGQYIGSSSNLVMEFYFSIVFQQFLHDLIIAGQQEA